MSRRKRIVLGITGASGALYAITLLRALVKADCEIHLIVSALGQRLIADELGYKGMDVDELAGTSSHHIVTYPHRDVGAAVASGSFLHDGMIICPCSNHTLACIANGVSENLMHRAASVTLKERRKLILCHRETPLSLIEIRNMEQLTLAGAVMAPANPGFYMKPKSIDDLVNYMVARLLDLMEIPHELKVRWTEDDPE